MRAYGYDDKRRSLIEDEAAIIREIARRVLAGERVSAIVTDLRVRGIKTSRGAEWTQPILNRMMKYPYLAGLRELDGELVESDVPAIISKADHLALVEFFTDPARKQDSHSVEPRHLLTSLLRCGSHVANPDDPEYPQPCGKPLYSQPNPRSRTRGYVCRKGAPSYGCGRIRISAEPLERLVVAKVLHRLTLPKIRERLQRAVARVAAEGFDVKQAEADLDARLKEAGQQYARQELSLTVLKAIDAQAKVERRKLAEQVVQAERLKMLQLITPEGLAGWWVDAPLADRQELLRLVLEHVIVKPASKRGRVPMDESRLEFVWK